MRYIQSTLIKGEKIIVEPKVHPVFMWMPTIGGSIALFVFLLLLIAGFKVMWVCIFNTVLFVPIWQLYNKFYIRSFDMAITNKRVVEKHGLLSVHSEELQWNQIESIEIHQGILGRIFNYGDVCFSGTGASSVRFESVIDPWKIKTQSAEILTD